MLKNDRHPVVYAVAWRESKDENDAEIGLRPTSEIVQTAKISSQHREDGRTSQEPVEIHPFNNHTAAKMSPPGQNRKSATTVLMSAKRPKAEVARRRWHFR